MYRVLTSIVDTPELAKVLRFKGGTCAAMRGLLNRFSVDLDFDIVAEKKELPKLRTICKSIFRKSGLEIKDQSSNTLQFFLKYPADERQRNSLEIDCLIPPPKANKYELVYLPDIDRMVWCQTIETMVANKLVAPLDRFEKNGSIAGRDIFDIHAFLFQGFSYNSKVIIERRNQNIPDFFESLIDFINKNITMKTINQDLNHLLPIDVFKSIRKNLKTETIMLLKTELDKM
jgi:predicted nucleotidyltransferase component of viral defense system